MKKKISEKDLKDWQNFIKSEDPIKNKDIYLDQVKEYTAKIKKIDLHGNTIEEANNKVEHFLQSFHKENVTKVIIITGKGNRSKNKNNPYQSENLSILKYSVPEYINSNPELLKVIKFINKEDIENSSKGSFEIFLKKFKE